MTATLDRFGNKVQQCNAQQKGTGKSKQVFHAALVPMLAPQWNAATRKGYCK